MKSKEEFEHFYENELKRSIENLESQRTEITEKYSFKSYKRNIRWLIILCVLAGITIALSPNVPETLALIVPFTIGYAIVAAIYIHVMRSRKFSPIKTEYKQSVIPKIIGFVDPELKYDPGQGISKEEFNRGGLFGSYTSYRSEDLVFGDNREMNIRMSDIECTRRTRSSGKNSSSSTVIVFKGFYIISSLKNKIPSGVIIKPAFQFSEAIVGLAKKFLGDKLVASIGEKLELNDIEVGDEEFDKQYTVKSVSPEVAKDLVTPRFIQLILSFQKELNLPVSFSFFDNSVHIAFSGINLFEADVYTSFTEKDISRQYFNYLNLAYGIIEAIQASR